MSYTYSNFSESSSRDVTCCLERVMSVIVNNSSVTFRAVDVPNSVSIWATNDLYVSSCQSSYSIVRGNIKWQEIE